MIFAVVACELEKKGNQERFLNSIARDSDERNCRFFSNCEN